MTILLSRTLRTRTKSPRSKRSQRVVNKLRIAIIRSFYYCDEKTPAVDRGVFLFFYICQMKEDNISFLMGIKVKTAYLILII